MKVCYITNIRKLEGLTDKECRRLLPVTEQYAFRINDYYYNLINWDDPKDPLRRLVIPSEDELNPTVGKLDACNEASYTPVRGCQHKYSDTAILLVNEVCGAYCRYCFRKRLFMNDNNDATLNCEEGLEYIAEHEEITNVLLTGGDPLIMSTGRLEPIINAAASIPHVRIIRIGTKMAAFNPHRIVDDMSLLRLIKEYCNKQTQIYIVNHFDHPREVTPTAQEAIRRLRKVGAQTLNQCPIVRGVNDDARTLGSLFRELSFMGCPQYYVFQGRPVESNESYTVPIVKGLNVFIEANRPISGLAKRSRFVMSHETGKIEICGVNKSYIFMRYHRAHRKKDYGRTILAKRDDKACWLDELTICEE